MNMSRDVTTGSSRSSMDELSKRSTTNTQTYLETCVLKADHKALKEHLLSNPVQQSDLDRCLLRGLRVVEQKQNGLSDMAPVLTILLQSGAKWNSNILLNNKNTPCHIICKSSGDHHELLDLMIKSSHPIQCINTQNNSGYTVFTYAVCQANINCLKCLIANGVETNIGDDKSPKQVLNSPLLRTIQILGYKDEEHSFYAIMADIFDLLLDNVVDVNIVFGYCTSTIYSASLSLSSPDSSSYGTILISKRNAYCIKKLINKVARLDIIDSDEDNGYIWSNVAMMGDIELLKYMFTKGLDKNATNPNGLSILGHVVFSGNIEAVRYLLDQGVDILTVAPHERKTRCIQCKENTLIIEDSNTYIHSNHYELDSISKDPCMIAIRYDMLEIVKLLEEHGSQSGKSFTALRRAVSWGSVDVASYLLNKYKYTLNAEYFELESGPCRDIYTLLSEPKFVFRAEIVKLLLDHGADPAKSMCSATGPAPIMTVIYRKDLNVLAQYIRSGANVNFRSTDYIYGNVLPFEASVLYGNRNAAEMLLITGCSCGKFSLDSHHEFKYHRKPGVEKLMKEWKVQENNVTPLKHRCRSMILNQLSPRADKKIGKLQLPGCLIKFLHIPEIDDIVAAFAKPDVET